MRGLEIGILCLLLSSYWGNYCHELNRYCSIISESEENYETPVYTDGESAQFEAFVKSVDFKKMIDSINTLTSIPHFPYLTTEEIQTLSEIAIKLRIIDETPDYSLDDDEIYQWLEE